MRYTRALAIAAPARAPANSDDHVPPFLPIARLANVGIAF